MVYQLLMAMRYERKLAGQIGLWSKLCTMLANFRREDREQRQGRKSWSPPETVIERRPDLLAKVVAPGQKSLLASHSNPSDTPRNTSR